MVSDRLKEIIFKKLYKDLSHVEIIPYGNHIWFIDRDKEHWYFRYDKTNGQLLWRYNFFSSFFKLFSLYRDESEPIMSSWMEEVLNYKVNTTVEAYIANHPEVEEVINYKVNTTPVESHAFKERVDEVLNCKVDTTYPNNFSELKLVDEVLNSKVESPCY